MRSRFGTAKTAPGLARREAIMAKRCEICGKGPIRPQHQPRAQRHQAALESKPAKGSGPNVW